MPSDAVRGLNGPVRGVIIGAALAIGCAPDARLIVLPSAHPAARVALVSLDGAGRALDVGGPLALDEVPSFALSEEAVVVAAFAIEPGAHRALGGGAIDPTAFRVARASDPPAACRHCAAPRDVAPALVAPGDRCPPPPFAPAAGTREGPDGREILGAEGLEAARRAVVLEWPGACGAEWQEPAAERAPIIESCAPTPAHPELHAQAASGAVLALARVGGAWTLIEPDGRSTNGRVELGATLARGVTAVPGFEGHWAIVTAPPTGEPRATLSIMAPSGATIASASVDDLWPRAVAPGPEPGTLELLGNGRLELATGPLAARCTFDGRSLECRAALDVDRRCATVDGTLDRAVQVGGRAIATTPEGHILAAAAGGGLEWRCLSRVGRSFPTRSSTATFAVRAMGPTLALGARFYACVSGPSGHGLLTFALPPAAIPDAGFAAEIDAAEIEVVRVRGSGCRGFVATARADEAIALVGNGEHRIDASGQVRTRPNPTSELEEAEILAPGWTVGRDRAGLLVRARAGQAPVVVAGSDAPEIAAIAPVDGRFVALRARAEPLSFEPSCTPARAPEPLVLDGLDAILTATTAPLEAWGHHGATWWAWQQRPGGTLVLVRIDLAARSATALPLEPGTTLGSTPLTATALLGPSDAVVTAPDGRPHRIHVDGDRVVAAPLVLTEWGATSPVEPVTRWGAAQSAGGVAWIGGNGHLARVTLESAEVVFLTQLPREAGDPRPALRSRLAGLMVLAPNHVLVSTLDVYALDPLEVSILHTRDLGPADRPCTQAPIGAGLGACAWPDSASGSSLTGVDYGVRTGAGPSADPLVVNDQGLVYGPVALRGAVGFTSPVAAASASGWTAVAGPRGQLWLGRRAIEAPSEARSAAP